MAIMDVSRCSNNPSTYDIGLVKIESKAVLTYWVTYMFYSVLAVVNARFIGYDYYLIQKGMLSHLR